MADVFISYAREDRERVHGLASALESDGFSVWWDHRLHGGSAFAAEIERALNGSRCVIVVWSVHSVRSEWVLDEAGAAKLNGSLLPIRLDATTVPMGFRQYQEIDFTDWHGSDSAVAYSSLVASIHRFLHGQVATADLVEDRAYSAFSDAVAVLPLDNLSANPEQQFFVDGMHEALITELSKVSSLKVISRTSTRVYAGSAKSAREIGAELGVAKLIEGSVMRLGDQVRMAVRLIDARADALIWSDAVDGDVSNIFDLQHRISSAIVERMKAVITPEEQSRLVSSGRVEAGAYDAYLRGMYYWYRLSPEDLRQALANFDVALACDPNYAPAHAGIAMAWAGMQQMGAAAPAVAGQKIKEAVDKALFLQPDLFQAHLALATYLTWTAYNWISAERAFLRALDLNPNHPDTHAYYSHLLNIVGRPAEAERAILRARDLDPFNPLILSLYGVDLLFWGRVEEAIDVQRQVIAVAPGHWLPYQAIKLAYRAAGRTQEMTGAMRKMFAVLGWDQVAEALRGELVEADSQAAFLQAAEKLREQISDGCVSALYLAELYDLAGRTSDAAMYITKAFDEHDPNIPYLRGVLAYSEAVMREESVREIIRKLNYPVDDVSGEL